MPSEIAEERIEGRVGEFYRSGFGGGGIEEEDGDGEISEISDFS